MEKTIEGTAGKKGNFFEANGFGTFAKQENLEVLTLNKDVMESLEALLTEETVKRCDYVAKIIHGRFGGALNFYIAVVVENHEPLVYFFLKGAKSPVVIGKKERRTLAGTYTLEYDDILWSVRVESEQGRNN